MKTVNNLEKTINFLEQITRFLSAKERIKSKELTSLFLYEPQEQFIHGHSFVKSDESDFLTVALF